MEFFTSFIPTATFTWEAHSSDTLPLCAGHCSPTLLSGIQRRFLLRVYTPASEGLSGIERRRGGCPLLLRRSPRRTPTSKSHLVREASARISEPKPMVLYTDVAPASFPSKSSKSP
ncbi:hypothetical protein IRJ41_012955 [Triplophysa rosa]|uniref:Uncharacterized protein n=1 Tax=Triplophysa rosa TaxID=992332 RepID=A0A9W7WUS0_TRIRA|nr:hypothetical protein IRJ41_012955 [Triplophysa rosa]